MRLKAIADDRTKVNLLSIIIGGTGLLAVLTTFSTPELNMIFLGENPFAIKRDAIASVMAWPFGGFAFVALLLQVVAEVMGDKLPSRRCSLRYYAVFSVSVLVAVLILVYFLNVVGGRVAKSYWWPQIVRSHTEMFGSAEFLVEHDGWRADQLETKDQLLPSHRAANLEAVEQNISQIEKLLELPPMNGDLRTRVARLKPYFVQTHP